MATNQTLTIEFNSHLTPNAYNKAYNERIDILSFNLFQTSPIICARNAIKWRNSNNNKYFFRLIPTICSQVFELHEKKDVNNLLQ